LKPGGKTRLIGVPKQGVCVTYETHIVGLILTKFLVLWRKIN